MADPADFFKDQLPFHSWPTIPTVLRTAYAAAADLAKSDPILQVESAQDNKGRLISWAVDFGLKRAVDKGSLSCDYRWRTYAKPTGRYLELRFSHSTASVSQIEDPKRQPRNVVFRENARLRAPSLFEDIEEKEPVSGAPHFLLVHGHQELNFAHFGAPSSTSKSKWTWLSQNLMKLPHEMPSEGPGAEDTDVDLDELNLLKEDIERWMKDNDGSR
ncbi:hypothetical protein [Mesorhizobium sp. M0488]|uniref:hypothetical protein n=1 Tax=unclassified Mesorhizobium TaxID=325217 RepID=UPI00333643B7